MEIFRRISKFFHASEGDTNEEIADLLIRFVEDTGDDPWEFDDFISCSQRPEIMDYRDEIARMCETHPPTEPNTYCDREGMARIRMIAEKIRAL